MPGNWVVTTTCLARSLWKVPAMPWELGQPWVLDLTVFIAGDGNVVYSPKFETGSREHLELHGAQDKGLEICRRSQERTTSSEPPGPAALLWGLLQENSLAPGAELVPRREGKICRDIGT